MLRDKFAMAAMQGMYAQGMLDIDWIAAESYRMADAMMRERKNWDFSKDPEQPTGFIVSDTPIKRVPLEQHHEATQGKAVPPEEWQPDWSQAPAGYNWWAIDENLKKAFWYKLKHGPCVRYGQNFWNYEEDNGDNLKAPLFGYQGDWRDSLRKRPIKPVPPVTETPPLKMEAP